MQSATDSSWLHLTERMDVGGHVTLGRAEPFEGVAIAANAREVFALLRRCPGERAAQIMERLEDALATGAQGAEPTNEIGSAFSVIGLPCTG